MSVQLNPVIGRELKERVRGLRAFIALSVFVIVLVLTAFFVYESTKESSSLFDIGRKTRIGRDVFEWILLVMTALVLFFVPGLTAGAVAGERERQTLQPLQVTLLRPRSILVGKVLAAVAYLVLLIIATLPLMAMCSLLGGVRVVDIVRGTTAVILTAVVLSAMVVCISTFAKRVQTATVLAYGFTALLVISGPLAYGMATVLDARSPQDRTQAPGFLLVVNPVVMVADLTAGRTMTGSGPLSLVRRELGRVKASNDDSWFAWFPDTDTGVTQVAFGPGPGPGAGTDPVRDPLASRPPAWLLSLVWSVVISAALFVLADRRLRTPAEVER